MPGKKRYAAMDKAKRRAADRKRTVRDRERCAANGHPLNPDNPKNPKEYDWEAEFLPALRRTANVTSACRSAGITRSTAYEKRESDEAFKAAWDEALETALDDLEAALYTRGKDGVAEPVFYQGEECGTIKKYSDTAAMFILNGRRSKIFKHRAEVTGANGGPIQVEDARERIAGRIARIADRKRAATSPGGPDAS